MKLEILQEELIKGLGIVARAVASRPQLPVLANILLEAHKEGLYLTATDLELGVQLKVNSKVIEEGKITVPAKTLVEFVSSLPPGRVKIELKGENLEVVASSYRAKFQSISAEEFPKLTENKELERIVVEGGELASAMSQVMFAAARDSLRPVLTGILLEIAKVKMSVVATDGFRLAKKELKIKKRESDKAMNILIPARAAGEIAKHGTEEELKISYYEAAKQAIFEIGELRIVAQTIEGNYPDYNKIVPREFELSTSLSKEELQSAVRAAYIFARDNSNMMKWSIEAQKLKIYAETPERGESEVEVDIEAEGEGEVVFNAKYVLDFLSVFDETEVEFLMGAKLAPSVFRAPGREDFFYVLMPINV